MSAERTESTRLRSTIDFDSADTPSFSPRRRRVEHGGGVNVKNNDGRTPVDQMLQNGREDLAEVLRRQAGVSAAVPV